MQGNIFGDNSTVKKRKTTTDATETTVYSIKVGEGQAVKVYADVTAKDAAPSLLGGFDIHAIFSRQAAGDVTKQGYTDGLPINKTPGSDIDCDFVADTVNQQVNFVVTGVAATTINWSAKIRTEVLS